MKYKKLSAVVIALVLIWLISIPVLAAQEPVVYAGTVSVEPGEAVFIPIQIKDNPGLMGFRLTLSYDPAVLAPRAVTRGSVTQTGSLEDSIGTATEPSFDVVWHDTAQTEKNGALAIVGFTCFDKAKDNTEIKVSYTQADTFNEQYEDVVLRCENIVIDFTGKTETADRTDRREVTSEDIVLAVETVQGDPQIRPTAAVMESGNALLSQFTGDPTPYFTSPDEITGSYADAVTETFVNDVLAAVEVSKVQQIVQNALGLVGAASVETVSEDRRVDFIRQVEADLKTEAGDVKELSDYMSQENELAAIAKLLNEASAEAEENGRAGEKTPTVFAKHPILWGVCAAVAALLIALAVFLVLKKRKKKTKKTSRKNNDKEDS